MTRLREALHGVADSYPALAPPPAGMFDRARRAHLRRRIATGFAAVFALAALGYTTWLLPAPTVAAGPANVPAYFVQPPKWTADVRDAPIERALLAFVMSDEPGKLVIVGPESAYRTYQIQAEGFFAWTPSYLLAPDGRSMMVARQSKTELLDLASGRISTLSAGAPLAWSRDGSQAVLASLDDGELRVVRMPSGEVAWRIPVRREENLLATAFSPDGTKVAVQQGGVLSVQRPGGGPLWSQSVGARLYLAGPLAWTEDGSKIALSNLTKDTAFDLLDAATGGYAGSVNSKGGLNYVGEQGRTDGLPSVVAWHEGFPIVNIGNRALMHLNVAYNVVMTTAEGTRELQVSSVGTDWDAIDPSPPDPGPTLQRYRPIVSLTLAGLIALLGLAVAVFRFFQPLRRLRRRAAGRSAARSGW